MAREKRGKQRAATPEIESPPSSDSEATHASRHAFPPAVQRRGKLLLPRFLSMLMVVVGLCPKVDLGKVLILASRGPSHLVLTWKVQEKIWSP